MRGRGVQAEVLTSLALVMVTAIGVLAAFFFGAHSNQLDRLVPLLGRALQAEGESSAVAYGDAVGTATWFRVGRDAAAKPHELTGEVLDLTGHSLACVSSPRPRNSSKNLARVRGSLSRASRRWLMSPRP